MASAKPGLTGPALTQAAQQQNWDPSIQALVVFPDLIKRLNQDVTRTTNLGNAFLAQQGDVMGAIQQMRLRAQQAGKLSSTPQQTVTNTDADGQPIIDIEPANPQVVYVPNYDPGYFFNMGFYFGGGWGGWGGWGWHPGWGNRSIMVNNSFLHRNNFNAGRNGSLSGNSTWAHDSSHRGGVPYANSAVSSRYGGNRQIAPSASRSNRSAFGGVREGG